MKIIATDFLNARPLIQGLEDDGTTLLLKPPSQCAEALKNGEADFALLPSIEYARIANLSIVPGITISSRGPVKSVALFLKKELSQVRKIAVDQRSRTATALLKILALEFLGLSGSAWSEAEPDLGIMLQDSDAALLIGDQALREALRFEGAVLDLGEAWQKMTGLPFTYAFWAGRFELADDGGLARFLQAKESGLALREATARRAADDCLSERFILDYLVRHICYEDSSEHVKGLQLFYQMSHAHGLIEKVPELRFYDPVRPLRLELKTM